MTLIDLPTDIAETVTPGSYDPVQQESRREIRGVILSDVGVWGMDGRSVSWDVAIPTDDASIARRRRALAPIQVLTDIELSKSNLDGGFWSRYDLFNIALAVIDKVALAMGISAGRTWDDTIEYAIAQAARQVPAAARDEWELVGHRVVVSLVTVRPCRPVRREPAVGGACDADHVRTGGARAHCSSPITQGDVGEDQSGCWRHGEAAGSLPAMNAPGGTPMSRRNSAVMCDWS